MSRLDHLTTGTAKSHASREGSPFRDACPLREAADTDAAYLNRCKAYGLTREQAAACIGRHVSQAEYA